MLIVSSLPEGFNGITNELDKRRLNATYDPKHPTKIYGICGRKGSGKNAAITYSVYIGSFKTYAFAEPIKKMLGELLKSLGIRDAHRRNHIYGKSKEEKIPALNNRSAREILQFLGTEFGRDFIDKDIWTKLTLKQIQDSWRSNLFRHMITDVRFQSEAAAIRAAGGKIIKIVRSDLELNEFSNHVSETELDSITPDAVVVNDSTKTVLKRRLAYAIAVLEGLI